MRHNDKERGTRGQGTRDKGQGTRDKGQGTRDKGQRRMRDEAHPTHHGREETTKQTIEVLTSSRCQGKQMKKQSNEYTAAAIRTNAINQPQPPTRISHFGSLCIGLTRLLIVQLVNWFGPFLLFHWLHTVFNNAVIGS
jgi:hypothetical protein